MTVISILMRRLLKRASFLSTADLRQSLLDFIAFFNQTAKPFKWTYKGRPFRYNYIIISALMY
jgi:putative transposase